MTEKGTHRVPRSDCLHCGHILTVVGTIDGTDSPRPRPGDPVLCMACGAVATVDETGLMRPFTPEEFDELRKDPIAIRDIRYAAGRLKVMWQLTDTAGQRIN